MTTEINDQKPNVNPKTLKKEILNLLNTKKGDKHLYVIIFNILTHNNTVKNYTNNSNGVFFNLNSIADELIITLHDKINKYINESQNLKIIEESRECLINKMAATIDNNSYKTELQNLLTETKKSKTKLSTELEDRDPIAKDQKECEDEEITLQKKLRIKKSVENYKKPIVYTKVQERIKKIMSRSSSGRVTKNKSIEEEDRLYDSDLSEQDTLEFKSKSKKTKGKKKEEPDSKDIDDIYVDDHNEIYDEESNELDNCENISVNDDNYEDEETEPVEEKELEELEELFGDCDSEA